MPVGVTGTVSYESYTMNHCCRLPSVRYESSLGQLLWHRNDVNNCSVVTAMIKEVRYRNSMMFRRSKFINNQVIWRWTPLRIIIAVSAVRSFTVYMYRGITTWIRLSMPDLRVLASLQIVIVSPWKIQNVHWLIWWKTRVPSQLLAIEERLALLYIIYLMNS